MQDIQFMDWSIYAVGVMNLAEGAEPSHIFLAVPAQNTKQRCQFCNRLSEVQGATPLDVLLCKRVESHVMKFSPVWLATKR